ncbi:NAD(P)H-quinone oxidoreductase [Bacillus sp. FJAT-45350]|uniref:NAD(P)H-quinone oxidoreductase n=1 Tax=Bacillus sp. FJAT-45350 TaxID=2011014 RepID=UPI001C53D1BA|nr:NAD(P)H-quinone oxidoreductase [Bacillus sp. FJAT-45350]
MKAVVVNEETSGLYIDEVDNLDIKEHEIKVKVVATAINRADIYQRMGLYPPPKGESEILGLEMSGFIIEVGNRVEDLKVGDRVFSLLPGGGYAENVVIHAKSAMKIPEGMTYEEAASIPEAFLTAYLNLKLVANVKKDEFVLIHAGASGVGTAAIQIAKELGAKTIVTAGSQEKLDKCKELGADYVINYKLQDFSKKVLEITGEGVHVLLDFIGASYWEKNSQSICKGGRWVLLGLLGDSKIENFDLGIILQKNINLIGSTLRSKSADFKIQLTQDFEQFSKDRFENDRLRTVIDKVFSWKDVEKAHEHMKLNKNIGKLILQID